MSTIRRYTVEVTDPVTQEVTTLEADSEAKLEQLLDQHLATRYPDTDGQQAG